MRIVSILNIALKPATLLPHVIVALADDSMFIGQFLRFAAVGVIGTLVHYTALLALVELFSLDAVASSTIGAAAGATVNYLLNYYFTFASTKAHLVTAPSFMFIAATGLILNGLLMSFLIHVLSVHYLISQIVATGIVLCWNFVFNRNLTFRE